VAASIPSKRLETTIKAVEAANASLLIVGSGYLEEHLDRMGKKLLGQRYRRIQLPHSKMPAAYRAADIFTLCSDHSEAFGIVYLEALASGLPVVATDDASRREIVGPSGFYVKNPDETEEYASAIKRAISFKQTKNLITQAEKYSWEEISSLYEQELADTVILLRGEE
jgi:glycosyltransferase involved in cell wall biosynthesis